MKKNYSHSILWWCACAVWAMSILSSCQNDCDDIVCQNGGNCDNGACDCPAGTAGDDCGTFTDCSLLDALCPVNASCVAGIDEAYCQCNPGFSGDSCSTQISLGLLGTYAVSDVCTQGGPVLIGTAFTYKNIIVSQGNSPNQVVIEGFGGFEFPALYVKAVIKSDSTFVVPAQTWPDKCVTVQGQAGTNATFTDNVIVLPYQITYLDGSVDICTVTLTLLP